MSFSEAVKNIFFSPIGFSMSYAERFSEV